MWLIGDFYKAYYYSSNESPIQLVICAFFQVTIDCSILSQFWIYRVNTAIENENLKKEQEERDALELSQRSTGSNEKPNFEKFNKAEDTESTDTESRCPTPSLQKKNYADVEF